MICCVNLYITNVTKKGYISPKLSFSFLAPVVIILFIYLYRAVFHISCGTNASTLQCPRSITPTTLY